MRITDLVGVFPALMLLLAIYTWWQPVTAWRATVIFALYLWVPMARVVRAEISSLREREFVQAELSLGASDRRIFFRHLLPNASGTIIIAATSLLGLVFVLEATVEFFGIGVPSDLYPTLGNLIGDGQRFAFAIGPGLVDMGRARGAADADPRLRQSPRRRPRRRPSPGESAALSSPGAAFTHLGSRGRGHGQAPFDV